MIFLKKIGWNDFIPETWDDVIDLVAELQTQQLQFYLPVNDAGANALNPCFCYNVIFKMGAIYMLDNKETGLMSDAASDHLNIGRSFIPYIHFQNQQVL